MTDPETKAEALRLADEVGPQEAARRLDIKPATLRSWRHRAGQVQPPRGADPQDWAETKREGAKQSWETAQEALREVKRLLAAGKTADAQRAALTMAILTDKSNVLETAAERADERKIAVAEAGAATRRCRLRLPR